MGNMRMDQMAWKSG